MIYLGSRNRIAKYILPILLENIGDRAFVDLFCGGGNLVQHAACKNKIACDINPFVIAFLNKIKDNTDWIPPNNKFFTKEDYLYVKNNKELFPDYFLAHVGYNLSFGGKWFAGWCQNRKGTDYIKKGYNNAVKQAQKIKDITFLCSDYRDFKLPPNSIVYCDIPHKGTTGYDKPFNFEEFYSWCRDNSKDHTIFISEYSMPKDFLCIWEKEIKVQTDVNSDSKQALERLFTLS